MSIAVFTPGSPGPDAPGSAGSNTPRPTGAGGPQRLEAARLSDRLAALIQKQIDAGALVPGDRLPTEQQLAAAHGVSRTVVREAVHQLRSQGLLRSRQGSGVYVTEPPAHRALAFDPKVLESMDAVVQFVELRRVVEGEMAALAAQRATRSQLAGLKRAVLAIDQATARGELGVDEDLAFHRAIGEATGNPQFVRLLAILEAYLRDAMTVTKGLESKRADHMAQVQREHRAIVAAIMGGNAKAARAAAIAHHTNGERRLVLAGVISPSRVKSKR
jgi:GntR family transcriptional repressor for pyruvate dehydrogenase complex